MWRVFDGQDTPVEQELASRLGVEALREDDEWSHGVFGGYAVYDHEVSTMLLPLAAAVRLTVFLQERIWPLKSHSPKMLAFACSFNFSKIFLVDVCDGSVHAWTKKRSPLLEQAVAAGDGVADGLLRWMNEYARRLEAGHYAVASLRPEQAPGMRGISLFPAQPPELTSCVTKGVEVTASCIYMPEHIQGWTYSIAMRLVGTAEERGFNSCQVHKRHWEIQEEGSNAEHVRGEGLIGLYPILVDNGWLVNDESDPHHQYHQRDRTQPGWFRYQSCSGRSQNMRGIFGGEIIMVPGTIRRPDGKPFPVRLEPFRLVVPDFLY